VHEALGYAADKMQVIPNGFDLELYCPNSAAACAVRKEMGIPRDSVIIGLVARFDPLKDHKTFVAAAARLRSSVGGVHFVLCGEGVTWKNKQLCTWIEEHALGDCFHLLGRRADIPRLTAALDIASSSSRGEGFANVIGEAMACGVPCVVTDVGDSARIVGDTGRVVPAGEPVALAAAWQELIAAGEATRRALGQAARARIAEHYSLNSVGDRYQALYRELAACAE
jgi:glycosyltransferase involved in cell wall biosynthesis